MTNKNDGIQKRKASTAQKLRLQLTGLLLYNYTTIHNEKGAPRLSSIRQENVPREAVVALTRVGRIAQQQLIALEQRFNYVKIDKYVIMPTHIHAILVLREGQMPRPSLMKIVQAYKSLATRLCNQPLETEGQKLFQSSFYKSVLRNEQAYRECWNYIDGNPEKWLTDPEDL